MPRSNSERIGKIAIGETPSIWPRSRLPWSAWLIIVVGYLGSFGCQIADAKTVGRPGAPTASIDLPTKTLELLRDAGGALTPAVRASYIDWAKVKVLGQLNSASDAVPEDALHEIESDPTLSDAMFASVFPPDKTILHNYVELRSKLGMAFVRKYRSLVVGAAVAHRKGGVTERRLRG